MTIINLPDTATIHIAPDIDKAARAMTPAEKRSRLRTAGWTSNLWQCHSGETRPPERWYNLDLIIGPCTLGQAIRICLTDESDAHDVLDEAKWDADDELDQYRTAP